MENRKKKATKKRRTDDLSRIGEEIKRASSQYSLLIGNVQRIGRTIGKLQPSFAEFAKAICTKKPLCWSCRQQAANILVTVTKQTPQTQNSPDILSLVKVTGLKCPPAWAIEMIASNEIKKQAVKDICESGCEPGCLCVGPSLTFDIAHVKTSKTVVTDSNWVQIQTAVGAQCATKIDIEFDIQYTVKFGICMKGRI